MKNSLILYLSQHRAFWWLRSLSSRIYLWIGSQVFRTQYFARDKKDSFFELRDLFRITQVQLLLALFFAALLQFLDPVVVGFYEFKFLKIPDDSDYVTLLVTISGIGGVFIGLYYAAISSIGGSIYAKVPNNIRYLLAQERVGNVYMHFLSFITFLGISLVSFRVLGFERIHLAIPVMLVASGVGIIAFVKLGQRAFNLFDPTALSRHLFEQFVQYINLVKAGGYRWYDPSFQKHSYRLVSTGLDTLETLSDITNKEVHLNGAPFISLSKNIFSFLIFYENTKKYIPSDSQWYEQKYQHRDWYRTEASHVSMAHQTGTTLQPVITNNKEWVEQRVLPIIKNCLTVNLKEERYNEVLGLLDYLDEYLKFLGHNGRVDRALSVLEELFDLILEVLSQNSEEELVTAEMLEKVAIIERCSSLPITIAIAYRKYLEKLKISEFKLKLEKIEWGNDVSIYKQKFSSHFLPRLEWFKPRINFEVATEGQKVTPIWYQNELILQIEADNFEESTKSLITKGASLYTSWIDKTKNSKHPWLMGAVMSREWEYWHKIENHFELWPKKWSELSDNRKIEGLPWADFELETLKLEYDKRQAELLKLMSWQNLLLALLERPEGFPDYAGQFLHASGEVALDALISNDADLLSNIFQPYLYGCITRFDNLRPKSADVDWRVQQDFKISAAALLDVMYVSGYAKLMADLHENDQLWQIVVSAWEHYFAQKGEESPLPLLAAAISLTEVAFEIPHRGILRTNWSIRVNGKLTEVPRHEVFSRDFMGSDIVIDHDSPLVRLFAEEPYGSFHDGLDIFIAYYLRTKDGADQLDFGWKRRDLQESLDRETRHYQQNEGEGEAE